MICPKVKNRVPKSLGLHPEVARYVEKLANKFNTSWQLVMNTMLADHMSLHTDDNERNLYE